jgi:hypothetical protein
MSITKRTVEDKIEVIGDYKMVQIRTATIIEEDGVELTRSFHRHVLHPGQDISEQSTEVQAIANSIWTEEIIAAWEANQQEQKADIESSDESNSGE